MLFSAIHHPKGFITFHLVIFRRDAYVWEEGDFPDSFERFRIAQRFPGLMKFFGEASGQPKIPLQTDIT